MSVKLTDGCLACDPVDGPMAVPRGKLGGGPYASERDWRAQMTSIMDGSAYEGHKYHAEELAIEASGNGRRNMRKSPQKIEGRRKSRHSGDNRVRRTNDDDDD